MGCYLHCEDDDTAELYQITETEAYLGVDDTASHARFGKTSRSKIMYAAGGTIYVYLIYGMHHMLNIVTGPEGEPSAVLIRGIEGIDGPGRLTKRLGITKDEYNGKGLGRHAGLWIEARAEDFNTDIIEAYPRVGIDYADKEWRDKKLRYKIDT